jgi:hypothetical protein
LLQLGGSNALSNLSPLDSSVNRSFGAQVAAQLKDYPLGTTVASVAFFASSTAEAASNITLKGTGQFLFDMSPFGDVADALTIKPAGGALYGPGTSFPTYQSYQSSRK